MTKIIATFEKTGVLPKPKPTQGIYTIRHPSTGDGYVFIANPKGHIRVGGKNGESYLSKEYGVDFFEKSAADPIGAYSRVEGPVTLQASE